MRFFIAHLPSRVSVGNASLSVYDVLLHHSMTCCCCHSMHVHTLPRVVQAFVACRLLPLILAHSYLSTTHSLHSRRSAFFHSLCGLGRVRLRAWVPASQRESHSQWSSRRVGQGPRLTLVKIVRLQVVKILLLFKN